MARHQRNGAAPALAERLGVHVDVMSDRGESIIRDRAAAKHPASEGRAVLKATGTMPICRNACVAGCSPDTVGLRHATQCHERSRT
ncbi:MULTISPECIES: hypothetical protein [Cryobacterium]|uniref:hypothetical protein n=1 Tax=Cryobacterium TaxID=69578 RepID=UPI00141B34E3|nr:MULTISPECIES: hypothetical protein [Cryobacterium]